MKHEVNVSNQSGGQNLIFPAIMSKDSTDAEKYSSKARDGKTEFALMAQCIHSGVMFNQNGVSQSEELCVKIACTECAKNHGPL